MALAGALASKAECFILDEPTAMLDPEGRLEVAGVLRAIHKSGTALVQVTHQLKCLENANRIFGISRERVRQIEANLLKKLRRQLEKDLPDIQDFLDGDAAVASEGPSANDF